MGFVSVAAEVASNPPSTRILAGVHVGTGVGVGVGPPAAPFVNENVAVPAPGTVAFIEYAPVVVPATNAGAVATPLAFVIEVAILELVLVNVAPAPPTKFTVHVTGMPPDTGPTVTVCAVKVWVPGTV